jgi:tRNA 2-thiouridine synthesizing protein C
LSLETVDSILVAGVFDQDVSVLFKDQGVLQLIADQEGQLLGGRTVSKVLGALPEYGIDRLYVCKRSLEERNLRADSLALGVTPLDVEQQAELIAEQQVVLSG